MELEAADDALANKAARLANSELSLVWIDASKGKHDVAVLTRGVRDFFVRMRRAPSSDSESTVNITSPILRSLW
jgi:hypothetical protein